MDDHTPDFDIEAIRAAAKQQWLKENKKPINFLDIVERSVPWWLVIIAGVLFALSAPHTAAIFDKLTPGWGLLSPLGIEFGLLYTAFRRKRAKQTTDAIPRVIWAFEILLFVTAIIVNGAGAFMAVVTSVKLAELPLSEMANQFATFPAVTQVALILVPLAAFIIPIGTGIAGEGLAALVFERDRGKDENAERWQEVQFDELRKALFRTFIEGGMKPAEAKRRAFLIASGFISQGAPVIQKTAMTGSDNTPPTRREEARRLLAENPDWHALSLRELEDRTGIDHNTWSIAKKRHNNNGHEG